MMSADLDWAWVFKWDFPFFGAGLMTPGSTVLSFFFATIIVYGIIGPCLVSTGEFVAPMGFNALGDTTNRFFLWPGIALMTITAFTELLIHYDSLWRGIKGGILELKASAMRGVHYIKRITLRSKYQAELSEKYQIKLDENETFKPEELIPASWWIGGTFLSIVFTCAIMGKYFGMPVYQSIISIILGFIFSFVGIQATGETDINPVGSIGKMSQLVFARMPADTLQHAMKNNLMAGNISASAASQAVDMVGDLKTGQIVGASPRSQFWAQFVASFFAIGIAVGLFILFADAYPCITDVNMDAKCEFGLVAVKAWANVAKLLTGASDPLSRNSMIATIVCAIAGVAFPLFRHFVLPQKYHRFFPSVSAVGIAMINTSPEVPLAMFIGWVSGKIWKKLRGTSYDNLMYSVAAGMIAGQGISAILQALFKITGVAGAVITASCPMGDCS